MALVRCLVPTVEESLLDTLESKALEVINLFETANMVNNIENMPGGYALKSSIDNLKKYLNGVVEPHFSHKKTAG